MATPIRGNDRGASGLLSVENIAIKLTASTVESTPNVVGCYNGGNWDNSSKLDSCFDPDLPSGHALIAVDTEPDGLYDYGGSFEDLVDYIVGTDIYCSPGTSPGFDGWSRDMGHFKERNLGQASLFGGLLSYSTYIPNTNICNPEGSGYLYGLYYQTGTSWYKDVFGRSPANYDAPIEEGVFLGEGLSTTPNIHVGEGAKGSKAFIQTSVGQIVEIPQPNLPTGDITTGRIKWRDIE